MKRFILTSSVAAICFSVNAQGLPAELERLMDEQGAAGSIQFVESLSKQQREFFWQDTRFNTAGYLEVTASSDYLKNIDYLHGKVSSKLTAEFIGKILQDPLFKHLNFVGGLIENDQRANYLFRDQNKNRIAITVWNFKKAGTKLLLPAEFLNQTVNQHRAVLSLLRSDGASYGLWKMSWWSEAISYEVYVRDDFLKNGKPSLSPAYVKQLASHVRVKE